MVASVNGNQGERKVCQYGLDLVGEERGGNGVGAKIVETSCRQSERTTLEEDLVQFG